MDYATTYYKAMEVDDAESWGSAVADFGKYGITASLASGALGLANTAGAFANMFGADYKELDLVKTLDNVGMKATAKYAQENETLVDFGGVVAGSIVPGFLGIKALKAAQAGLASSTSASRTVTGLRAALVPKDQLKTMLDDMAEKGTEASRSRDLWVKAAKQGVHQQFLEATFAETAILLTMNQHSMLNDQDLGYIDSVKANIDSLVFGVALGGGIGAVAQTMGIKKQLETAIQTKLKGIRDVADGAVAGGNIAVAPGDILAQITHQLEEIKTELSTNPGDAFKRKELLKTQSYLNTAIGEVVRNTIKQSSWAGSPDYAGHIAAAYTKLGQNLNATDAVNNFAGLLRIKGVKEEYTLFEPRAESYGVYDSIEGIKGMLKGLDPNMPDDVVEGEAASKWFGTYGFAYIGRNNAEVKAAVLNGNIEGVTRDHMLSTMRHEIGHVTGKEFAKVLDTNFGKGIRKQMEEVSRLARPEHWTLVDRYEARIAAHNAASKSPNFSMSLDEMDQWAKDLKEMENHIQYMKNPDELIADNLSMFTSESYERLVGKFPDLDRIYRNNGMLRTRMRETEVIMDLQTGNLSKQVDRVPTIADMGKFKLSGGKVILEVGKADTRVFQGDEALNIIQDTAETASAKYLWGKANPFTKEHTEVNLTTTDFVGFNRVLDGFENHKFAGKVVVEDVDKATGLRTGTRTFDFAMDPERASRLFRNYVMNAKVDGIAKLRARISKGGEGKPAAFSITDVARVLDTDINFTENAQVFRAATPEELGGAGIPFWSEKYDPMVPTQVKNVYMRDLGAPTSETEVRSMLDVKKRLDLAQESAVMQIASYWGQSHKDVNFSFPDPTVLTSNNRLLSTAQSEPTQGFVNSQQGDFGDGVEFVNSVGRALGIVNAHTVKRIAEIMEPAGNSLVRSVEGMAEFSVSVTKFRQYKMEEIPAEWQAPGMEQAGGAVRNWFSGLAMQAVDKNDPATMMILQEKMKHMDGVLGKLQALTDLKDPMKFVSYDVLKKLEDLALSTRVDRDAIEELMESVPHQTGSIVQPSVANFWRAAREANQVTVKGAKLSASLRGKTASWNADQFYPGTLDRTLYKDIVFVRPKVVGLMGEKEFGIVGGPNPQVTQDKLALLRAKHGDNFEVITQQDNVERHKQLLQDYEDGLNIDSFYFDSSKLNLGKAADLMPDPNPQLVWSMVESYKNQATGVNRNLTKQYFNDEFQFLDAQEEMRRRASGDFGTTNKEASVYQDRMATMLNMPNDNRFKTWRSLQRNADQLFSAVYNQLVTLPARSISPDFMDVPLANYQEMNKLAERYGLPQMYNDKMQDYLVTSMKVNDQLLASAVPKLNWIGATMTLRLDYIQPLINAISLPIMAVPEIGHLVDALPQLQKQAVKNSLEVKAVDKAGQLVAKDVSNTKLMFQGTANWFKNKELHQRYRNLGIIGERAQLYMNAVDTAAMAGQKLITDGTEAGVGGAIKEALGKTVDVLTKPGDKMEDFVRFLAADMARQVLEAGGIKGKVADMAIQTYVNRVLGNYHYAQRPAAFQGFAGQAIGLFQTYQFNLIQQLTRHLGEKPSRAAAMMGLQTGIFGLQSTPGFEALNSHIAERSKYEGDFYTGAKEAIGQTKIGGATADEWLLYGLASNFTRPMVGDGIDLFSRGNLNPRSPIIVPSSWEEIPLVSMATKFTGSITQAADNLAGGVPVSDTFYQALATNGVNRPLQGIGQLMAGERITSRGSFMLNTEDLDWWQKGARIAGARGMDEALAVAHYYRAVKYESARQDKLESLGQVVKAHVQAGSWDGDAYTDFMGKYTQEGGDITKFDQWSQGLYKSATQSQINQMYQQHDSVEGRYMQQVMGAGVEQYINPWNYQGQ